MNEDEEIEKEKAYWKTKNLYRDEQTYGDKLIHDFEYMAGLKEQLRYRSYLREKTRGVISSFNRFLDKFR